MVSRYLPVRGVEEQGHPRVHPQQPRPAPAHVVGGLFVGAGAVFHLDGHRRVRAQQPRPVEDGRTDRCHRPVGHHADQLQDRRVRQPGDCPWLVAGAPAALLRHQGAGALGGQAGDSQPRRVPLVQPPRQLCQPGQVRCGVLPQRADLFLGAGEEGHPVAYPQYLEAGRVSVPRGFRSAERVAGPLPDGAVQPGDHLPGEVSTKAGSASCRPFCLPGVAFSRVNPLPQVWRRLRELCTTLWERVYPRRGPHRQQTLTSIFCFAAFAARQLPLSPPKAEGLCRFSGITLTAPRPAAPYFLAF
ncbi:protein of unknown function [Pseudomonas inefficax]|uniref:Uncharacterized protein n=1 Tax=Pseudomonas inefficax TaxID=2078786 RepID=A0AAQ1PAG2_9PSED|nr:protein of unknown function [Pseudomonas inefficax]